MIQMNEFKRIKIMALQTILFSMEEIKNNLEECTAPRQIETNSKAMKDLAEAFRLVKGA